MTYVALEVVSWQKMQLRDSEIYYYLREILLARNLTGGYIEGETRQKRNRKERRRRQDDAGSKGGACEQGVYHSGQK